jgi:hypothetical protein
MDDDRLRHHVTDDAWIGDQTPDAELSTDVPYADLDVQAKVDYADGVMPREPRCFPIPFRKDGTFCLPDWARSEAAKEAMVWGLFAAAPATALATSANISAWYYGEQAAALTAAVTGVAAIAGGVYALSQKWSPTLSWVGIGIGAVAVDVAAVAGGSGWTDILGWMAAAAMSAGARLAYLHHTGELKARTALVQARAHSEREAMELKRAKARTEELRFQLAAAKLDAERIKAMQPTRPELMGASQEETQLRNAFWDVFGEQLTHCNTTPTLSGWRATVGLSKLSRQEARNGWDKVASHLRAEGRFIVSNGVATNELSVKFVGAHAATAVATAWDQSLMPEPDTHLMSLGTDTETGAEVLVQFDERLLITGASGTGKSWSSRPLMAHAHLRGELLLLDGKGEEANIWRHVCQCATDTEEVVDAIDYAHAVMTERKKDMARRGISVWDGEQLTVNIDEGQVILATLASLGKRKAEIKQKLVELSSLGRSRGVVLWWQTQYGVTSGAAPGIDNLIAANMLQRFSLRVANGTHALVALDDCAYYEPQQIPDDRSFRGHGYLKGYGPTLIRTWTMNDAAVKALPPRQKPDTAAPFGASNLDKVTRYLMVNPDASKQQIADATGVPLGSVGRLRKQVREG